MNMPVARRGFTIVELLIVIVVIGILATLTIVAYNGVQSRAVEAQMRSDLSGAHKALLVDLGQNGAYPVSLAVARQGKGLEPSGDSTYEYSVNNAVNPPTYCLSVTQGAVGMHVDQTGVIAEGVCEGHTPPSTEEEGEEEEEEEEVTPPTTIGYHDFTSFYVSTSMTIDPGETIPNGSWMIVILGYTDNVYPTMPAGWTTLIERITTGTLRTSVYGKIKTSGDSFPMELSMTSGGVTSNGVLLWGSGAAPVEDWILGTHFWRDGTSGTQYITVAPSVTTTTDQNRILAISTERTTASETGVSSVAGAVTSEWFFIPQVSTTKIQSITVSTYVKETAGATGTVTVTYPNLQALNGMSVQLALPPATE